MGVGGSVVEGTVGTRPDWGILDRKRYDTLRAMKLGKGIPLLLLALALGWLSACGQRGPLYLPDDTAQHAQKKKTDSQ